MHASIGIVADSSLNTPDELQEKLGIVEVPAIINFGSETYQNKVEMSDEEFYRRLTSTEELPTTSQPTPQQFQEAYEKLIAEGVKEILAVCVSGKLSGTLSSAQTAAEETNRAGKAKVHCWDTEFVSMAGGWQAVAAAEMAREHSSVEEILAALAKIRSQTVAALTVETLKYLAASGRVTTIRASIGTFLNVKPILQIKEGLVLPSGQVRGRKKSLRELITVCHKAMGDRPCRVTVAHGNIAAEAEEFLKDVKQVLQVQESNIVEIGPVLACHAGPGVIALCVHSAG